MGLKHVYLFEDPTWGIGKALPSVASGAAVHVFNAHDTLLDAIQRYPKDLHRTSVILICDNVPEREGAGFALVRRLRFDLGARQPIVILSFDTEDRLAVRLAPIPIRPGICLLRVPVMLDELQQVIQNAEPLSEPAYNLITEEYQRQERLTHDQLFRHRCANVASVLRILQGARYAGDVTPTDYRDAIQGLADLAGKDPALAVYRGIIAEYLASLPEAGAKQTPRSKKPRLGGQTVLLLDDEAVTAGWQLVLTACLKPLGLQLEVEASREHFQETLAASGKSPCDVLLLDLRMPDNPEASIEIIERMAERHPTVPVIVFTALADVLNYRKCQQAGAFDYFVKELSREDRDPQAYYMKFKEILLRAVEYRTTMEGAKAEPDTLPSLGRPALDVREFEEPAQPVAGEVGHARRTYWRASFAFSLDPPAALAPQNAQICAAKIHDDQQRLLTWLIREPADGRSLSVRYFCDPDQRRLEIAMIGATEASDRATALQRAKQFFADLQFYLTDTNPPYAFSPVRDGKTLLGMLDGVPQQHLVAIEREPLIVEVDGQALEGVFPFSGHPTSTLAAMLKGLLQISGRVIFTATLWPAAVSGAVRQSRVGVRALNDRLKQLGREDSADVSVAQGRLAVHTAVRHGGFQAWVWDEQASRLELLRRRLDALATGGLAYRCDLASESPLPGSILNTFRYDFFGEHKESWSDKGGVGVYEVQGKVRLRQIENSELSDRHMSLVMLKRRQPATTTGLPALEDILDMEQARALFRLPFPTPEGVRGMQGEEEVQDGELSRAVEQKLSAGRGFLAAHAFRAGKPVPVRLRSDDLMQHLYVCGKSGTGKSTLLLHLALSMIEQGKGLCLIDPHGDLATALCERIPDKRKDDLVLFDPTAPKPLGLNLLENDGTEEQQDLIVQEFISMMMKLFRRDWMGPNFERGVRCALIPLMTAKETLAAWPKLWRDNQFRKECLDTLRADSERDRDILSFWSTEVARWSSSSQAEYLTYFTSKFDRFVADAQMRKVLGQSKTGIPFGDIVNGKSVIIVRIPKGGLGDVNAYLLGMIVAFKVRVATQGRAAIPPAKRKDFFLIVDEFQNFVGSGGLAYTEGEDEAFTSLLSEARKFRLGLVLANQYVHQLGPAMRNAVFGNVQSRIAFAVSGEDAEYLSAQFASSLKREDFQNLPKYHAYAQLLVNNETLPPFRVKTIPPSPVGVKR